MVHNLLVLSAVYVCIFHAILLTDLNCYFIRRSVGSDCLPVRQERGRDRRGLSGLFTRLCRAVPLH